MSIHQQKSYWNATNGNAKYLERKCHLMTPRNNFKLINY